MIQPCFLTEKRRSGDKIRVCLNFTELKFFLCLFAVVLTFSNLILLFIRLNNTFEE